MKISNPLIQGAGLKPEPLIIPVILPLKKLKFFHDISLNVSFKNALIRVGVALLITAVILFTNKALITYISPVIFYLFVTALTKFCVVKYVWHRYIKHDAVPKSIPYGEDPNYPEESI